MGEVGDLGPVGVVVAELLADLVPEAVVVVALGRLDGAEMLVEEDTTLPSASMNTPCFLEQQLLISFATALPVLLLQHQL